MSFGREDPQRREAPGGSGIVAVRTLRLVTSISMTILILAALGALFAPRDGGTMTMYGLVIGINLLICLGYWPVSKWLQGLSR